MCGITAFVCLCICCFVSLQEIVCCLVKTSVLLNETMVVNGNLLFCLVTPGLTIVLLTKLAVFNRNALFCFVKCGSCLGSNCLA